MTQMTQRQELATSPVTALRERSSVTTALRATWIAGRRKPLAATGAVIVLLMFLVGVFAPLIANDSPEQTNPVSKWASPGADHYLGGDHLGRDIFSRVVYGARVSFAVGFGATAIGLALATLIGVTSGFYGGTFDMLLQRVIDIAISFPFLILLLTVTQILPRTTASWSIGPLEIDPSGQKAIYLTSALGVVLSFNASRVVRSAVLSIKGRQYIDAARTIGASNSRILGRYIVPNIFATVIVLATVYLGSAVLIESSLAFLGFGLPPTIPSWGQMLNEARPGLSRAVNPSIWPGLAIALTVWAFNMVGDGLRDVLDPRLRGSR